MQKLFVRLIVCMLVVSLVADPLVVHAFPIPAHSVHPIRPSIQQPVFESQALTLLMAGMLVPALANQPFIHTVEELKLFPGYTQTSPMRRKKRRAPKAGEAIFLSQPKVSVNIPEEGTSPGMPVLRPLEALTWDDAAEVLGHLKALMTELGWPWPRAIYFKGILITAGTQALTTATLQSFMPLGTTPLDALTNLRASAKRNEPFDQLAEIFRETFGIYRNWAVAFRYTDQAREILTYVAALPPQETVKITVFGAWHGEDTYPIAIMLRALYPERRFEIEGIDLVEPKPQEMNWIQKKLIPNELQPRIAEFFTHQTESILSLREDVRESLPVRFKQGNVATLDAYTPNRNVIVANGFLGQSVTGEEMERALTLIVESLKPGGRFFIDNSAYIAYPEQRANVEWMLQKSFSDSLRRVKEGEYEKLPHAYSDFSGTLTPPLPSHEVRLKELVLQGMQEETERQKFLTESEAGYQRFMTIRNDRTIPLVDRYRAWLDPFVGKLGWVHLRQLVADWPLNENWLRAVEILRKAKELPLSVPVQITLVSGAPAQLIEAFLQREDVARRLRALNITIHIDAVHLEMDPEGLFTGKLTPATPLLSEGPSAYPVHSVVLGDEPMKKYGFGTRLVLVDGDNYDPVSVERTIQEQITAASEESRRGDGERGRQGDNLTAPAPSASVQEEKRLTITFKSEAPYPYENLLEKRPGYGYSDTTVFADRVENIAAMMEYPIRDKKIRPENVQKALLIAPAVGEVQKFLTIFPNAVIDVVNIDPKTLNDIFQKLPESFRVRLYRADASRLPADRFPGASYDFVYVGIDESAFYPEDRQRVMGGIVKHVERVLRRQGIVYHVGSYDSEKWHQDALHKGTLIPVEEGSSILFQKIDPVSGDAPKSAAANPSTPGLLSTGQAGATPESAAYVNLKEPYQGPVIVVGGSSGGMEAFMKILAKLPEHHPPVLFNTHTFWPHAFQDFMRAATESGRPVQIIKREDITSPVSFALERNLILVSDNVQVESAGENGVQAVVSPSLPISNPRRGTIDGLFYSAAASLGSRAVAVILSGAGEDGLKGARRVAEQGGQVLVQTVPQGDRFYKDPEDMRRGIINSDIQHAAVPIDNLAQAILSAAPAAESSDLRTEIRPDPVRDAVATQVTAELGVVFGAPLIEAILWSSNPDSFLLDASSVQATLDQHRVRYQPDWPDRIASIIARVTDTPILSPEEGIKQLRKRIDEAVREKDVNEIVVLVGGLDFGIGKSTFVKLASRSLRIPGWNVEGDDATSVDVTMESLNAPRIRFVQTMDFYSIGIAPTQSRRVIKVFLTEPPVRSEGVDVVIDWRSDVRPTAVQLADLFSDKPAAGDVTPESAAANPSVSEETRRGDREKGIGGENVSASLGLQAAQNSEVGIQIQRAMQREHERKFEPNTPFPTLTSPGQGVRALVMSKGDQKVPVYGKEYYPGYPDVWGSLQATLDMSRLNLIPRIVAVYIPGAPELLSEGGRLKVPAYMMLPKRDDLIGVLKAADIPFTEISPGNARYVLQEVGFQIGNIPEDLFQQYAARFITTASLAVMFENAGINIQTEVPKLFPDNAPVWMQIADNLGKLMANLHNAGYLVDDTALDQFVVNADLEVRRVDAAKVKVTPHGVPLSDRYQELGVLKVGLSGALKRVPTSDAQRISDQFLKSYRTHLTPHLYSDAIPDAPLDLSRGMSDSAPVEGSKKTGFLFTELALVIVAFGSLGMVLPFLPLAVGSFIGIIWLTSPQRIDRVIPDGSSRASISRWGLLASGTWLLMLTLFIVGHESTHALVGALLWVDPSQVIIDHPIGSFLHKVLPMYFVEPNLQGWDFLSRAFLPGGGWYSPELQGSPGNYIYPAFHPPVEGILHTLARLVGLGSYTVALAIGLLTPWIVSSVLNVIIAKRLIAVWKTPGLFRHPRGIMIILSLAFLALLSPLRFPQSDLAQIWWTIFEVRPSESLAIEFIRSHLVFLVIQGLTLGGIFLTPWRVVAGFLKLRGWVRSVVGRVFIIPRSPRSAFSNLKLSAAGISKKVIDHLYDQSQDGIVDVEGASVGVSVARYVPVYRLWLQRYVTSLNRNGRLLSVGGGDAETALGLKDGGQRVVSIDRSRRLSHQARQKGVIVSVADGEHLPFAAGSFDTVLFSESIGYHRISLALQEAYDVLKIGGHVVITIYNLSDKSHTEEYYQDVSLEMLKEELAKAGFLLTSVQQPHSIKQSIFVVTGVKTFNRFFATKLFKHWIKSAWGWVQDVSYRRSHRPPAAMRALLRAA
jgi:chemotaxis response regulator CheB/SAM-dependent methyltransferase/chemotaxis methyl-accepting protein methylase